MLSLRAAAIRRCLPWLAMAAAVFGCGERIAAPAPVAPLRVLARVQCVATTATRQLACVSEDAARAVAGGVTADLIVGGQNTFVTLTSSNVVYAGDVFSFTTTVQNLLGQALGTTDGTTLDPTGVRVFFEQQPVATSGSGSLDFINPVGGGSLVDGYATFTQANQPYYQYNELLSPSEVSPAKGWAIHVPATVGTFAFSVYVSAPVQYPTGYVVVSPATATLRAGGSTQALTAVVKDVVSRTVPDAVTWSSSDPAVASVDANSGVVTPVADGLATITATSTTRTGTAVITVSAANGGNTTITGVPATLTVGSASTITVQARTAAGANMTLGGDVVLLSVSAGSVSAVTDNNNGTYTATLNSTVATTISITGTINSAAIGHPGSVTFTAGTPASMVKSAGDGQSATSGSAVSIAPAVTVTDTYGNPVSGVSVAFTVASGGTGAAVTGSPATTNASGIATAGSWTLGNSAATNTLDASATGLSTVTFTATGTAGLPASATIQSANPQSAAVNAAVAAAPSVLIRDANNNPVPGVQVTFAVTGGGGSATGTTPTTNAGGIATVGSWTLGTTSGTSNNTLSATAATGSATASFTASATPAAVHHFIVEAAGGGTIPAQLAGSSFNVKVTAQDQFNNTATSFTGTVGFTTTPPGGVAAGATSAAFSAGVLGSHAITLGTPGDVTLTATRSSGGSETGTSNSFQVQQAPAAVADAPGGTSVPGDSYHTAFNTTFTLATLGVLANDTRGFPLATVVSFGADNLGGAVTDHAAGTAVSPLPGYASGSIVVNANGGVTFAPPTGFTGLYVIKYRISNVRGISDAQLTIAVGVRPAVTGDTYPTTLLGNVPINTATSSTFNVTTNDAGDAKVLAAGAATNGAVTLAPGGTFSFTPNAGYTGPASFTYTVTNGFGTTASATVNMTVSGIAWFIDRGAGAGDGRFGTPFNDLSTAFAAATRPLANQPIFLYANGTAYTGGITLLAGQKLVGAGATGASFASVMGVAWPADAGTQPGIGGTNPSVNTALTLGSGNTLQGFNLTAAGTLNGTSFGTLTVSEVGINTTTQALNLATGTIAGSFTQVRSTGGTNNVLLSTVATSGTTALGTSADVLSGATGDALKINGGIGSFTYAGTITNAASLAVNITGKTGGTVLVSGDINPAGVNKGISVSGNNTGTNTITFSGANKKISSGAAAGVNLANNTGATISFTGGGLAITTTSGNGFSATGGGTVNVTGTVNTITSAGGIALNVSSTDIGASGLTFQSISANGGSNGIALSSTGILGGLTVTGTGTFGTGGTIQNTTGADGASAGNGIYLSSTRNVNLSYLQVNDHGNNGLYGTSVVNLTLTRVHFSGANGNNLSSPFVESAVKLDELTGSASITGCYFSGGMSNNFRLSNTTGSLNRITFATDTFAVQPGNPTTRLLNDALLVQGLGNATVNTTIQSSRFEAAGGDLFQYDLGATAVGDLVLTTTAFSNSHSNIASGGGGVVLSAGGGGSPTFTYSVTNNTFRDALGTALVVSKTSGTGTATGTISGNLIGVAGVDKSGSQQGSGIDIGQVGGGTHTTTITGNTIRQFTNLAGVLMQVGNNAVANGGQGRLKATIQSNTMAELSSTVTTASIATNGIHLQTGTNAGDNIITCATIGGAGTLANTLNGTGANGGTDIRLRALQATTLYMIGYSGSTTVSTERNNFLIANNKTNPTASSVTGGTGVFAGGSCPF
ncbi:MAG: hypothetical protein JWM95_1183 [Gemmatimonadetes bacterium]|nr:hypothetical protein [Gemmatimonadota bacterium]